MKELSIEEKAKRYDVAIKRVNDLISRCKTNRDRKTMIYRVNDIESIFPGLKESEDERIELLNYLHDVHDDDEERARWIAWLEKQAEHANFISKIQVGDKVTRNEDGVLVNLSQLKRVAKKDEKQGELVNSLSKGLDNAHERIDGLIQKNNSLMEQLEKTQGEQKHTLQTDNVPYESSPDAHLWTRAICFDGEPMESKPCEQNTWSEEDEKMLEYAINMIEWYSVIDKSKSRQVSDWLKSLKERYTWKPSDSQMASITCAVRKMKESACYDSELVSLLNDLKKLKG